jgi:hypothetical protein
MGAHRLVPRGIVNSQHSSRCIYGGIVNSQPLFALLTAIDARPSVVRTRLFKGVPAFSSNVGPRVTAAPFFFMGVFRNDLGADFEGTPRVMTVKVPEISFETMMRVVEVPAWLCCPHVKHSM